MYDFILMELSGDKKQTFMYEFNEEGFFNKILFNKFMTCCNEFLINEKDDVFAYADVCAKCISTLEYILFLFICNFIKNDSYRIKNYPDEIDDDYIYEVFFEIRDISEALILKMKNC